MLTWCQRNEIIHEHVVRKLKKPNQMSNRELIEQWYNEMWNKWKVDIFPEILHSEITFRGSLGHEKKGHEGLKKYMDFIKSAFPDFHNKIEQIITEGNYSFAKLKYTGTHKGKVFGIEPTNRKIIYYGTAVFTIENEKIKNVWVLGDIFGLIKQLE